MYEIMEIKTILSQSCTYIVYHSFAVNFFTSFLARSRSSLRRILPEGFLGIASIKTTPPVMRLMAVTFPSMNLIISSAVAPWSGFNTIYARGRSSSLLISDQLFSFLVEPKWIKTYTDTPMTATSATAGCSNSSPSSSAGATWLPLTLISSYSQASQYVSCNHLTKNGVITFIRSTTQNLPSSSIYAISPVFNHPSAVLVSCVA